MTVALHGDIRVNHCKIGEWWAVCQPGKDGIHPYRWSATLNGTTVRGILTHDRADGALALASKVTAAAAIALAEATRAGWSREPRPEFQALIDAFQLEYDALLRQKGQQ